MSVGRRLLGVIVCFITMLSTVVGERERSECLFFSKLGSVAL